MKKLHFLNFLNLLHLDEETYILSLRIFLNEHHQILKPMHLVYVLLLYGLQIQIFNLF